MHRSNSVSPTDSPPARQMRSAPASAPRAHKSDQRTSQDPLPKSTAKSQIRESAAPAPAAVSPHTPPAPPSSPSETSGPAPGKSPTSSDAPAPTAAPPAAAPHSSPRRRAPAAPHSAPPTTDAAGTCCTRPKSNTWPRPDQTPPRHLPARRPRKPPRETRPLFAEASRDSYPKLFTNLESKSVTNDHPTCGRPLMWGQPPRLSGRASVALFAFAFQLSIFDFCSLVKCPGYISQRKWFIFSGSCNDQRNYLLKAGNSNLSEKS